MIKNESKRLFWKLSLWKDIEINKSNNDLKNDLNISKKINKRDRLSLTHKLKISISFKTSNNFSLILKSLSHDDNIKKIKKIKKMLYQSSLKSFKFLSISINCYRYVLRFYNNNEKCLYEN